jgi:hypothetical protein
MTRRRIRTSLILRSVVAAIIAIPYYAMIAVDSPIPMPTRALGALCWSLALLPAWTYLGTPVQARAPLPFLPMIGSLFGLYYALPLVLGSYALYWRFVVDPRTDYDQVAVLILVAWILIVVGARAARGGIVTKRLNGTEGDEVARRTRWLLMIAYAGLSLEALRGTSVIPISLGAIVQAAVTIQRFAVGLLIVLHTRKRLKRAETLLLLLAITASVGLQFTSGSVGNMAFLMLALVLPLWVARRRMGGLTVVTVGAALLTLLLIKGIIADYRTVAWTANSEGLAVRGVIMAELLSSKIRQEGFAGAVESGMIATAGRSANLDLFADVVRRTPSEIPYWGGETYKSLVGIAIPRILWPGKPKKTVGQDFGHRYDYLSSEDTGTAVNLPQLVESYANFGEIGVIVIALVIGGIYGTLDRHYNAPGQSTVRSLMAISLLIPLFNIESDFSLVFGGLLMNAVALRIVVRYLHLEPQARPAVRSDSAAVPRLSISRDHGGRIR